MTPAPATPLDPSSAVSLGRDVDIFSTMALPEFNTPGGQAYAGRLKNESRTDVIAIICNSGTLARVNFVNAVRSVDSPCMPKFRESGVVHWPLSNSRHYALAYERPLCSRFWKSLDETHKVMSEDAVNQHFVAPLIGVFSEFQRTGLTHGGIRPTNIFWHEGGATTPQLAECLSAPCGIGQPVIFETLERAMCLPSARGPGSHTDDTYAFGITLAFVIMGQNPLAGMDDHAILQLKLDKGSFSAIVGNHRLASSHVELLRGLLSDDSRQRWTANELQEWSEGRRSPPKSAEAGKRASRGFDFMGRDYWQARPLAAAMAANVTEAAKIIENKSLERWLQRSMDDANRTRLLTEALEGIKEAGKTAHFEEMMVSRCCIALDPAAPIRFLGISSMPDGLANLVAETLLRGGNTQVLSEILASPLVSFWVNAQKDVKADLIPLTQQMDRVRGIIEKPNIGNGIERAAYELNPTLPCLSPMVKDQYVLTARTLLPALERAYAQPNRSSDPIDRHIAAFMIVHDKRGDQFFDQMQVPSAPQKRGLVLLTLFSDMQYRHGPDQLPGLAAWILPSLDPAVKRFFNKHMQEKIRSQLKTAAAEGDLGKMIQIVDDPQRLIRDESEFLNARLLYHGLQKEMASVTQALANRDKTVASVGRSTAASLASALAILMVIVTIVRAFLHSLG